MTARGRSALAWSQSSVSPAMARPASWSASPPISPRAITPSIWRASPRSCSAARAAAAVPTWRRPAAPTAPRQAPRSQRLKRRWPRPEGLEHDPEKWAPVFRKGSCSSKGLERDDDSKISHRALALAQEHVFRGVGRALEAAGLVARTVELAADRVDSLHGGDAFEDAAAAA